MTTDLPRKLRLARPRRPLFRALAPYAEASGLVPESDWTEFEDAWPDAVKIKDQGQFGACDGHATALADELARHVEGLDHVPLSAWYPYAILCGGVDEGASISEALGVLEQRGCAPEALVPWGTINPARLTPGAHAAAAAFKVAVGSAVSTRAEVMSAVQRRQPLNLSVCVADSAAFSRLDAEGVPPAYRGVTDHAVCVWGGARKSPRHGWLVKVTNSWGPAWGLAGHFWYPLAALAQPGTNFDAFTVKATAR